MSLTLPKLFDDKTGVEEESRLEAVYLNRIATSMLKAMESDKGKKLSRSLSMQKTSWVKEELSDLGSEKIDNIFLFSNLDGAIARFKEYVLLKYEGNKKEFQKWNRDFEDLNLKHDLETVVISAIYEYKYNRLIDGLNLFVNPVANRNYQKVEHDKKLEQLLIQSNNSSRKTISTDLSVEQHDKYDEVFYNKAMPVIQENYPTPLPCIGEKRELVNRLIKLKELKV